MKKAISGVLVAAMLMAGAGSAFAYTPADTNDPKCIDIRNLNEKRWISLPEKPGKKVCGLKNIEVAAITYDKLDEYISNVEKEMKELDNDIRTNDKKWVSQKLKDLNKVAGRELALSHIRSGINAKNYNYGNYCFVSTNHGVGELGSLGKFAKKDDIKYEIEYDDEYFNKIKNRIDTILEERKGEFDKDEKAFNEMSSKLYRRESKIPVVILLGVTAIFVLIGIGISAVANKIEQAKEKKNIDTKSTNKLNMPSNLNAASQ